MPATAGADTVEHDEQVKRSTESERFRRESRLRSSQDFQRVRRKGRRQQGQWLMLTYARRLAPVAPPTANDAVTAPLVSRLWKTQPGWDMIVVARPEAANADYATLAGELHDLLTRARLLR